MYPHILFDLDGTLIDSADAILEGFQRVLADAGLTPQVPIDRRLIGPALRPTLARLSGLAETSRVETLAHRFTAYYDTEGYRGTTVYLGITELLAALHEAGSQLYIVTNKRLRPTLLILDWLGWSGLFQRIDTQDMRPDAPLGSKSAVLGRLLAEQGIRAGSAVYVGDRIDDQQAATENGLSCVRVAWGYGAADPLPPGTAVATTPAQLLTLLGQK